MFTWENKSLKRESIKGVLMMSKKKERKKESEQKRKNDLRRGEEGAEQSERERERKM
jgi:hypothetical protein